MRDATITNALTAPVSFIVHCLNDVNAQLERGRPFFNDIVKQGIVLYHAEGFNFAAPRDLPVEEARDEARLYFDEWFPNAARRIHTFGMEIEEAKRDPKWRKDAAFTLHQATERLYHCTLLTLTLYSPKSHRLTCLRSQCEQIAPSLMAAWPRNDRFARRCFELLRQAYVNARYSPHYEISDEELQWLGERVAVCRALFKRFANTGSPYPTLD